MGLIYIPQKILYRVAGLPRGSYWFAVGLHQAHLGGGVWVGPVLGLWAGEHHGDSSASRMLGCMSQPSA